MEYAHLTDERWTELLAARADQPALALDRLRNRPRRPLTTDGRLFIVAYDHTSRGALGVPGEPFAMADRRRSLEALLVALSHPGVDGVLGSADVLEELALLGALDGMLAFGTMNRGGMAGAAWELDDRMTAYDAEHVEASGLDGGKTLLRIDHDDPAVARTIESVAAVTTQLADRRIMAMIEPLPYVKDASGWAVIDSSHEALVKAVAIASGLGASSAYTWLKIPGSDRMSEVAGATTMPVLMLGGDPGADAGTTFSRWQDSMREPNVRGLVAGRALLYPHGEEVEQAVARAASFVHPSLVLPSLETGGSA